MERCESLKDISDTEQVCEKGFPSDITCETGEKVEGGSAYACWYYRHKERDGEPAEA